MRASYCLISVVILLGGQSQSAPILGLGFGSTDGLLGGLTRNVDALPVNGGLNDGLLGRLLGGSKDGLLGSSQTGKLLTVTGYNGGALVSTDGLLGESSLNRRLSLPLIGEFGSFDGFKTKVATMASGLGSKLSGLLRKRDGIPSLTSAFSSVPGLGYMPGFGTLPTASTLPGISSIPGLTMIPGLGSSAAPSGFMSKLAEPAVATASTTAAVQSPSDTSNAALSGLYGGLNEVPGALDTVL